MAARPLTRAHGKKKPEPVNVSLQHPAVSQPLFQVLSERGAVTAASRLARCSKALAAGGTETLQRRRQRVDEVLAALEVTVRLTRGEFPPFRFDLREEQPVEMFTSRATELLRAAAKCGEAEITQTLTPAEEGDEPSFRVGNISTLLKHLVGLPVPAEEVLLTWNYGKPRFRYMSRTGCLISAEGKGGPLVVGDILQAAREMADDLETLFENTFSSGEAAYYGFQPKFFGLLADTGGRLVLLLMADPERLPAE